MLERRETSVDVAFAAQLSMGPYAIKGGKIPLISACIRVDFSNYDLWPPSLVFVDYETGDPAYPPIAQAFLRSKHNQVQNVLIDPHPISGRPFFCVIGTREYHTHHQHNGVQWLSRRTSGEGTLARLCDLIWRSMVHPVFGMNVDFSLQLVADADIARGQIAAMQQQALQAARQQPS
jgi:hypothetical protein